MVDNKQTDLESRIDGWREWALGHGASDPQVAAAEAELREQVTELSAAGLDPAETFLVALKRVAVTEGATREYVRTYASQLLAEAHSAEADAGMARRGPELPVVLGLAVAAALAIKVPELFGYRLSGDASLYARNLSLFCLPFLAAYFMWKRGITAKAGAWLAGIFAAGGIVVNAYPFAPGGSTEVLAAIHLPIALWLVAGVAYVGGEWRSGARRMEYVRFTGEWLVSFALVALGGGVLIALTVAVFGAVGADVERFIEGWLPSAAMGAVIVAAWLAESRRSLLGGFAPMLARVFTPLFTLMLAAALMGVVLAGGVINVERDTLIIFDLLLVVVLALVLYAVSARDRSLRPGPFDWIQLALVVAALAVDVFALVNIVGRLAEFGFSANRAAALGLNLILLANLGWSAVLQAGFVRARERFARIEQWQTRYLPVYALWAMLVVVTFPLLFNFS